MNLYGMEFRKGEEKFMKTNLQEIERRKINEVLKLLTERKNFEVREK